MNPKTRVSNWVNGFFAVGKFERRKMWEEADERFEREAEDNGLNMHFGVVKNLCIGQGKF